MLGGNQRVVFDESHLGEVESGSIAGLARNYHLEGLALALLTLAGLYVWKNSSSLLPPYMRQSPTWPLLPRRMPLPGWRTCCGATFPQRT
jgi:hypothetical protein